MSESEHSLCTCSESFLGKKSTKLLTCLVACCCVASCVHAAAPGAREGRLAARSSASNQDDRGSTTNSLTTAVLPLESRRIQTCYACVDLFLPYLRSSDNSLGGRARVSPRQELGGHFTRTSPATSTAPHVNCQQQHTKGVLRLGDAAGHRAQALADLVSTISRSARRRAGLVVQSVSWNCVEHAD